jgi:hypothetical protein
MFDGQNQKPLYATLALRIKASVIDSTILFALIILIPLTIGQFPDHPGLRAFLMYAPCCSLSPYWSRSPAAPSASERWAL